jgi:hydrogenase maturation protease
VNRELVDKVVHAVLYEGYILYPYRASSKKNQRERFTFGRIYPREYSEAQHGREPCSMQTECLARNESHDTSLEVNVRFLQPLARETDEQVWLEAIEREVKLEPVSLNTSVEHAHEFTFPAARTIDGTTVRRNEMICGRIELETQMVDQTVSKITVRVFNETRLPTNKTSNQEEVIMRTFASMHTILHATGGEFISLLDPDPQYQNPAKACRNIGCWPVLVGDEAKHDRDTMLSSPIILYDYPKIAPESSGDLFDSTEIDEILSLRVQTMTDAEKTEMRSVDEQARRILERTENLSADHFMKMHGTMKNVRAATEDFFNPAKKIDSVKVHGVELKKGDRVRIRPRKRADVIDMALDGKIAIIEAVEQDVEEQIQFALILEDDPGKDLGFMRQPGHRFFYGVDEIEPVTDS